MTEYIVTVSRVRKELESVVIDTGSPLYSDVLDEFDAMDAAADYAMDVLGWSGVEVEDWKVY